MTLRTSSAIPGEASPGLLIPGFPGNVPTASATTTATVSEQTSTTATVAG